MLMGCDKHTTKFLLRSLSREKLCKIVGIISSHNTLNYQLYKMNLLSFPNCKRCDSEVETAKYFLCNCPLLAKLRVKHLGDYYITQNELKKNSNPLLRKWMDELKKYPEPDIRPK